MLDTVTGRRDSARAQISTEGSSARRLVGTAMLDIEAAQARRQAEAMQFGQPTIASDESVAKALRAPSGPSVHAAAVSSGSA